VRYDVGQWLFICYVYMFWLADEDVSLMRWDEEDSKVMEVCEGHVYEGVRVSMGMDSSEVIEYAGWNESSPDLMDLLCWSWMYGAKEKL
jgi:hypothetical protein